MFDEFSRITDLPCGVRTSGRRRGTNQRSLAIFYLASVILLISLVDIHSPISVRATNKKALHRRRRDRTDALWYS